MNNKQINVEIMKNKTAIGISFVHSFKKKFLFFPSIAFFSLSLLSCDGSNEKNEVNLNYPIISAPLKNHEITDLPKNSLLYDSIDYVRLSSDVDGSLLGAIIDIKINGDDIYILSNNNTIFHFLYDGSFVDKLHRKGRGRGEYLNISKFDVTNDGNEIFLFDGDQRRMLVYSKDFEFKRQIDLEDIVFDFALTKEKDILFFNPKYFGRGRRGAWVTDSLGIFKKQLLSIDNSYKHEAILDHYFVTINDEEIGLMGLEDNDCFYKITSDSIAISAKMVTDLKMSKRTKRSKEYNEKAEQYVKAAYYETENVLQFDLSDFNQEMVTIRYDKRNDKTYRTYLDDYTRIKEFDELFPRVITSYKSIMIQCLSPAQIMSSSIYSLLFPEITENSNPVLVLSR